MLRFRVGRKKGEQAENPFWITYSDLLSSLVMIFLILILAFQAISTLQAQKLKEQRDTALMEAERAKDIDELAKKLDKLLARLQELTADREIGKYVSVDKTTGDMFIIEQILFEPGEAVLRNEGKLFLNKLMPKWSSIILSPDILEDKLIKQVVLEGHADPTGPPEWNENYLFNLKLTLARSEAVARYIFSPHCKFPGKEKVRELISASGRSNIEMVSRLVHERHLMWDTIRSKEDQKSRSVKLKLTLNNPLLNWRSKVQSDSKVPRRESND